MRCTSSRFGAFDITDDMVLTFPSGLLGFPDQRRYVMLDHDTDAPFKWLQSLDEPALAFVVIDPALFHADYRLDYPREAVEEIGGGEADDVTLAVILTIPSEDPGRITANLRGPLLMNPRTKLCKQLVLSDDYPTRYPLFPAESPERAGAVSSPASAPCPV
jgi:flagellar assembly factor FliW